MNILEYISFAVGITAIAIIIWGVILGFLEIVKNESLRFRSKEISVKDLLLLVFTRLFFPKAQVVHPDAIFLPNL